MAYRSDLERGLIGIERNECSPLIPQSHSAPTGTSLSLRWSCAVWKKEIVACFTGSYMYTLLVFVPFGIASGMLGWPPTLVFALNFVGTIPLGALLGNATEELALHVGRTAGGLINATFGNAVELIVSIIALRKNELRIVQASMLGSILSNILLVLGCSFLIGGFKFKEQSFNSTAASTMSSLMVIATASLILPLALYHFMDRSVTGFGPILQLSRGISFVLLALYFLYLFFQFKTHTKLFEMENDLVDEEEEEEEAQISLTSSIILLVIVTAMVSFCADYLVASIDAMVATTSVSKTLVGFVLIPIVGNAAEHMSAVRVASKNKMDLALSIAMGSSIQIALFMTPSLVLLGWIMGKEMSLCFQFFETIVYFISVLLTNYLIQDGKSNYLEGTMLLGVYAITVISFSVIPDIV